MQIFIYEKFRYIYEEKMKEINRIIKNRNIMLEEREKVPYLTKEEFTYIIKQIKEHDNTKQLVMKRISKK